MTKKARSAKRTSLQDRLGQMLMIGISGPTLNKDEVAFLKRVKPWGVVYFKRNIESPRQLSALSKRIQKVVGQHTLIGIDQEGGRVARLKSPLFTEFPPMAFMGQVCQKTHSLEPLNLLATAMCAELRSLGINLNFTPVADVHTQPKNPIIGDRAFGVEASFVAHCVAQMVRAYRREGIVSCAKHFPGHGDTLLDSHLTLPTVDTPRATLMRRELLPFKSAIAAKVPTVMTAHVVYKHLDAKRSATLSRPILDGLLRRRLGYRGVIISDDLEMNAIAQHYTPAQAALAAVDAGVDLLLVCESLEKSWAIYEALDSAHASGELDSARVRASLARLEAVRRWSHTHVKPQNVALRKLKKMHAELLFTLEKVASA